MPGTITCKHDWEVEKEIILPSAYEQLQKGGQTMKSCRNIDYFTKTLVIYIKCKKCSKLKVKTVRS